MLLFIAPTPSYALELSITGNGGESVNETVVNSESNANVNQSSETNINNNVESSANTGGNEANGNSSNVNIESGNASNTTVVENSANSSQVTTCCEEVKDSNIVISENGSNSHSSAQLGIQTNLVINSFQNATITNNIVSNANTGENKANYNNGNISIATGQAKISTILINAAINNVSHKASSTQGNVNVLVSGNGSSSTNIIKLNLEKNETITTISQLLLVNNLIVSANTGNNEANKNNGDVDIKTGDAIVNVRIENVNINSSSVISDCCKVNPPTTDDPGDPVLPPGNGGISTSNPGSSSSGTGGGGGGVLGASGAILPATGADLGVFWATFLNIILLTMGLYFRRRAGRSPSIVHSKA